MVKVCEVLNLVLINFSESFIVKGSEITGKNFKVQPSQINLPIFKDNFS